MTHSNNEAVYVFPHGKFDSVELKLLTATVHYSNTKNVECFTIKASHLYRLNIEQRVKIHPPRPLHPSEIFLD